MKIKNREDLQKLRSEIEKKYQANDKIKLLIGVGTCGTAAGGMQVYESFSKVLKEKGINNVELVKVGCVGFCYAEPTVEVVYPDGDSVLLGRVMPEQANDIINLHIKNRCNECSLVLKTNIAKSVFEGGK